MWFAELEGIGVSRGAIEDLICGGVDVETVRRQDLDDEELGISTADADLIFAHVQARLKVPPIIFLDIDGVLNRTVHATHIRIDADLVSRLAAIVEASGARIVLTTFWREFDSYIAYILSRHGIDTKCVIGATTGRPTAKMQVANPASRAFEIADFVRATGATRYVILDDRGDAANTPEQFERFVQTDASVGLTPEDVDRAIKILCGAEAEDAATSAALAVA
ncbi:hypothetical protein M885DRAFT_430425 [Pelagophyceae sp. CCMP2097]|nr:hypothetical protein M885DRAFT_430425 [Pelagophyceae sp. CCMP2097]